MTSARHSFGSLLALLSLSAVIGGACSEDQNLVRDDGTGAGSASTSSGSGAGGGGVGCIENLASISLTPGGSMLTLDACPVAEDLGGSVFPAYADRSLRVADVGCMSPCKAWSYPAPYGLHLPESQDPGLHLCCPTPIDPGTGQCTAANGCITPAACRAASDPLSVVHTDYVQLVHARCPTAYAYSYDDDAGLHACSADTGFRVEFCS